MEGAKGNDTVTREALGVRRHSAVPILKENFACCLACYLAVLALMHVPVDLSWGHVLTDEASCGYFSCPSSVLYNPRE